MVESFLALSRRLAKWGHSILPVRGFLPAALFFLGYGPASVQAQSPSAAVYPASPSASAGMTSSTSSTGMTSREIQMMQVRTAAQSAQGDAVAASMSRTADRAIDEQNSDRVLQQAREEKAIKSAMRERMKWDRANAQVKKVSANDMSSWRSDSGNVRVERNVPDPFISSLIEEERQIAAREASEGKKKGFGWRPFRRDSAPAPAQISAPAPAQTSALPSSSANDGGGGFFSKFGRGNDVPEQNAATAQPQFVQTSSRGSVPAPTTAQATVTKPGTVPRISGAALLDGRSPVNQGVSSSSSGAAQAATPSQEVVMTPAGGLPDTSGERSGFFSKLKSGSNNDAPSSARSGGGFFGFGKKKESRSSGPTIDASLFPSDSVAQAPTGGSLDGGYSSQDVAQDSAMAPSSTGNIELPGGSPEKRSRGFSIPKPNISIPSFGDSSGGGGGSVPTMTTTNSSGTNFYVVTSAAQFMIYGNEQMQSEVRALPAGMVVQMTKPGENWASVRLSNGTEGIVQNKFLRAASMSEASTQFNFSN